MTQTKRRMHERITVELTESGKRASDVINEIRAHHTWDELRMKWVAIRLSDGSSDKVLYDTRADCVKHQTHEQYCWYVAFRGLAGGANPRECAIMLLFYREAYEAGFRGTDPDAPHGGSDLALPAAGGDQFRKLLAASELQETLRMAREFPAIRFGNRR